jgi:hypothetical protein
MKIIFLDFDGVLNNADWISEIQRKKEYLSMFEKHEREFDPSKVKLMSDFALEIGASVVISSSWRKLHTLEELQIMLHKAGFDPSIPIIDVTPDSPNGFRGSEVEAWINGTHHSIEDHVIFDDDGDFHYDQPLVKTSWDDGLCDFHIERAKELLNRE